MVILVVWGETTYHHGIIDQNDKLSIRPPARGELVDKIRKSTAGILTRYVRHDPRDSA
jgi:hypothetical protein